MSEWISVKERLPEKKDLYLVICDWPGTEAVRSISDYSKGSGFAARYVSYWQPYPDPPEVIK